MSRLALAVLLSTACTLPSTVEPWILAEWRLAQEKLVGPEYGLPAALNVPPEMFRFVEMPGPFRCGDVESANGCYSPAGLIRYNVRTPHVIRHEAGHAILDWLGDSRRSCFEHSC